MSNEYYDHTSGAPGTSAPGSSSTMRTEFDAIGDGFDKMPTLAGNQDKFVVINSGATGLTSITVNKGILFGGIYSNFAIGTLTTYMDFNGTHSNNALDELVKSIVPVSGTLANFRVKIGSNSLSESLAVNLLKNGVPTGITVTIPAGSTAVVSDTTNTLAISAADTLTIQTVSTAGTGVCGKVSWTVDIL